MEEKTTTMLGHNRPKEYDTSLVTDALDRDYAAAEARTRELLDEARDLPKTVASDIDVERFAVVIRALRDHGQTIEAYRKAEKEPHLRGGQAVDGWFGNRADRLGTAMKLLHARVDDYQQEKLERARQQRLAEERKAREEAQRAEEAARRARSEARRQELEVEAKMAQQRAAMAQARTEQAEESPADAVRQRFAGGAMATMAAAPTVQVTDWDAVPLERLRPYLRREEVLRAVRAWARATSFSEEMPGVQVERGSKTVIR